MLGKGSVGHHVFVSASRAHYLWSLHEPAFLMLLMHFCCWFLNMQEWHAQHEGIASKCHVFRLGDKNGTTWSQFQHGARTVWVSESSISSFQNLWHSVRRFGVAKWRTNSKSQQVGDPNVGKTKGHREWPIIVPENTPCTQQTTFCFMGYAAYVSFGWPLTGAKKLSLKDSMIIVF